MSSDRERLLATVAQSPKLVAAQGRLLAVNGAGAELFGTPQLEGRPITELRPLRPKPERGWRPAQARKANGTPLPVEVCAREVGGRRLYCVRPLRRAAVVEDALRYFDVAFDRSPIGMAVF